MRRAGVVPVVLAAGLALGGCVPTDGRTAGPTTSPPRPSVTAAHPLIASRGDWPEGAFVGDHASVVWGATHRWEDGLAVRIGAPVELRRPGRGPLARRISPEVTSSLTVTNGSEEPYDLRGLRVRARSDGRVGRPVPPAADGLSSLRSTVLAPGEEITAVVAFAVREPADVAIMVAPGRGDEEVQFSRWPGRSGTRAS